MSTRVKADLSVSLDGVAAGHDQSLEHPFGPKVGERLHTWMFEHKADHETEVAALLDNVGAHVMGRNMFTAGRGELDPEWTGWWGPEPPYEGPVFVLTHYQRAPVHVGRTTFTFVNDGLDSAMAQAREAAGEKDISIAGGATTVNAALAAGHLDELRLHIAPFTVGEGVRVFENIPDVHLVPIATRATPHVTHVTYARP